MGFFHACKEVVTQMASRIQGITVEIGGDTTKLSKALESVNKSIKGTQSGLKDVNKLLKLDPSNTELVVQKQKMLKDAIEATKEKLATLKTAAQQANEQLANGEITQQQYDALQREIVETEQNLRSLQDQAATTNATLAKIDEAGEKLQNIGSSVENVGKKFLPVTAAVTGLGTAAVKTAADFDSEMSKVSAISGATGDDFDQLRAKAREMGAKTKFSASEAASAMEYMAMAGWKTSDMLNGIEGIMNLAAASGEDLATTSDIVTDALTAFGLSAADSGHFADILAAASSNANTNVSMMGETFKYCAPIAGALGFSAEDTAEAIGLMANSGIKASQAGTSLRTIMNNLSGEVTFVGKNIGEVTIATSNADGSMRSLNDILADCRVAFSGLSESEKAANAEALVGKNAMSGFLALMNSSETDINKLRGAIENCDGASESMAETMQDNLNGQLTILKSQLEELAISFGDMQNLGNVLGTENGGGLLSNIGSFLSKIGSADGGQIVSNFGNLISGLTSKMGGLGEGISGIISKLGSLGSSGGGILSNLGGLLSGVVSKIGGLGGSLSGIVSSIGSSLGGIAGTVGTTLSGLLGSVGTTVSGLAAGAGTALAGVASSAGGFLASAGTALAGLAGTAGIAVAAVGGIGLGLTALWKNCDGFREGVTNIWNKVTSVFSNGINAIKNGISNAASAIGNVASSIWDGIKNVASSAVSWGKDIVGGIAGGIKKGVNWVGNAVKSVASGIRSFLHFSVPDEEPLADADTYMPDFMKLLSGGIKKGEGGLISQIKSMAAKVQQGMEGISSFSLPELTLPHFDGSGWNFPQAALAGGGTTRTTNLGGVYITVNGYNARNDDELAQTVADKINGMIHEDDSVFK